MTGRGAGRKGDDDMKEKRDRAVQYVKSGQYDKDRAGRKRSKSAKKKSEKGCHTVKVRAYERKVNC